MTKMRRRRAARSAEEWDALVTEWRRSGKTAAAFAIERDLCRSSLYGWASRLREEGEHPVAGFVPVRVVHEGPSESPTLTSSAIEIVAHTGRVIRVIGQVDAEALVVVLEVAERC